MKNGEFYYGDQYDPAKLAGMLYPCALTTKIRWAQELIVKLDSIPLYIDSEGIRYPLRDITRRNRANKAIRDNRQLLADLQ
jgi:hypothetical protein